MADQISVTAGELEAIIRDVRVPMGLLVDTVRIAASGIRFEGEPLHLALDKPGAIEARVSEKNLQAFLEAQAPAGLSGVEVALEDGKVLVSAVMRVIVEIRAHITCALEIVDGAQLWVRLVSVDVLGVGPRRMVEKQLERINPVFDASALPLSVRLEGVTVADGELILSGTAAPKA